MGWGRGVARGLASALGTWSEGKKEQSKSQALVDAISGGDDELDYNKLINSGMKLDDIGTALKLHELVKEGKRKVSEQKMYNDMLGGNPSLSNAVTNGTPSANTAIPTTGAGSTVTRPTARIKGMTIPMGERGSISMEYPATPEELKLEAQQKGLPIETGGKLAMVMQAKKDINDARSLLFPKGTPESFSRGAAFASNVPMSRGHLISGLIPQALPGSEVGQKIYSKLQNAVAAKLRVETGAQANPSEVENILQRFGVTSFSNANAAWDALKRLEDFMDTTTRITDPQGVYSEKSNQQTNTVNDDPLGIK